MHVLDVTLLHHPFYHITQRVTFWQGESNVLSIRVSTYDSG